MNNKPCQWRAWLTGRCFITLGLIHSRWVLQYTPHKIWHINLYISALNTLGHDNAGHWKVCIENSRSLNHLHICTYFHSLQNYQIYRGRCRFKGAYRYGPPNLYCPCVTRTCHVHDKNNIKLWCLSDMPGYRCGRRQLTHRWDGVFNYNFLVNQQAWLYCLISI